MMNLKFLNFTFGDGFINLFDYINLIYGTSLIIIDKVKKIYTYLDVIVISVTGIYLMAGNRGGHKIFDTVVKGVTLVAGGATIAGHLKGDSSQGSVTTKGSSNTTTTTTTNTTTTTTTTSTSATKK